MNFSIKKISLFKTRYVFSAAIFLIGGTCFADVKTLGANIEANGVKVEIISGEVSTEAEMETVVQGVSQDVISDRAANPESFFEAGWLNLPSKVRSPSGLNEGEEKPKNFVTKLIQRLAKNNIAPDRTGGFTPPAERSLAGRIYSSRVTWVVVRVGGVYGLRFGSLFLSGMSASHAAVVAIAAGFACTLSGSFYGPITNFANKWRFYNSLKTENYPRLAKILGNTAAKGRLDDLHGSINWGFLDILFDVVLISGESIIRELSGLPLDIPGFVAFTGSAVAAILTQGQWDKANGRNKDLDLIEGTKPTDIAMGNFYFQGVKASLFAVLGFAMASTPHHLAVQAVGVLTIGTLGVLGYRFKKAVSEREAKLLTPSSPCDAKLKENFFEQEAS